MDRVLVIGGCGGFGHHIVKQLLEKKEASDVTVFDIGITGNNFPRAKYIKGDLGSQDDVREVIYEHLNVEGTKYLLEVIREVKCVKALVYTSSSSVISNNIGDIVFADEVVPKCYFPEQTEYNTHTKALGARKEGLLTVVLRGNTVFGEGDHATTHQMVGSARFGRRKMQVGDGENLFDFTYLGNSAYAYVLAAKPLIAVSEKEKSLQMTKGLMARHS